ncbi:hypothetical protein [Leifsonia shinshuensis]|uniref:Uncharacterized protein n=1 Tax=Leifsonia shinshuensis TaxID=150026 RepID=A0A7G6YF02_9MICO|nr:hypothetical protein [Leifsonia shinshuensis]QNE37067.1 hypothetical protein F1C12_19425 [Leifsonia shinshuensis]
MPSYSPMKPNSASPAARAAGRSRSDRAATPPSGAERAWRPLGYLLVAVVWTVLAAVVLALPAALTVGLATSNPDFTTRGFFAGSDVAVLVLFLAFAVIVLVPLLGYAFVALALGTVPLAVLSWTYVVRSLSPGYAGERLSSTGWSRNAIGPVTVAPTAMSLLPVRVTPWAEFWVRLMFLGWKPSRAVLLAGLPYGLASFLLAGWLLWPVGPVAAVVWTVVTAALVAAAVVLVVRAYRAAAGARAATGAAAPRGR